MYTVEVYKQDGRTKTGERRVLKANYTTQDRSMLEHVVKQTWPAAQGFRYEIHTTYVTRQNLITGETYQERYDTSGSCSPSSEAYWSR